ncbi:MAG: SDR family oxidoreductase [Coriobacteriia bacterium]|nr:SDR family oxidoreductase [Coriobacteriia bacterium]
MRTNDFTGKSVIVTGGSSGIGLATAKAFASRGASVALIARDEGRLAEAKQLVEKAGGTSAQVLTSSVDVSDTTALRAAIDDIMGRLGTPDVLVNSAGVFIPGYFEEMPPELFKQHMDIDVLGLIAATQAVVPAMKARGSGHIVNVASVAGFIGVFGYTAYSTAKYAVMGFSEALRSEMKPLGIKVSVVCPPDVDTPGLANEKLYRPAECDKVCGNIKAIAPEQVAAEIVRAVESGRYYVVIGGISRLYFRLKGLLPELFFAITDGDVASARKNRTQA